MFFYTFCKIEFILVLISSFKCVKNCCVNSCVDFLVLINMSMSVSMRVNCYTLYDVVVFVFDGDKNEPCLSINNTGFYTICYKGNIFLLLFLLFVSILICYSLFYTHLSHRNYSYYTL